MERELAGRSSKRRRGRATSFVWRSYIGIRLRTLASVLSSYLPGVALVGVLSAAAFWLAEIVGVSQLVTGVLLGALVANAAAVPTVVGPGAKFAARTFLRAGVVMLGFRLSLSDVAELGVGGIVVVGVVVATTLVGTQWLAKHLGIGRDLGLLVASGYAICGASAIAAVNGVVRADEEETAYAIALVTLCGTLSIVLLPPLGQLLGLDPTTFGTWAGAAVHDVGQVVATASQRGADSLEAATVVKLTRVVLLAPLVAGVSIWRRREAQGSDAAECQVRPPIIPAFVVGFLAAVGLRSFGILSDDFLAAAGQLERVLLTSALVAMGLGVQVSRMRRLGARPLVLGLLSWILVAVVALGGTLAVG